MMSISIANNSKPATKGDLITLREDVSRYLTRDENDLEQLKNRVEKIEKEYPNMAIFTDQIAKLNTIIGKQEEHITQLNMKLTSLIDLVHTHITKGEVS